MTKVDKLCEAFGYEDEMDAIQEATYDSVAPGICVNPHCDYTTEVEPDCRRGWCPECNKSTVQSILVLKGMI